MADVEQQACAPRTWSLRLGLGLRAVWVSGFLRQQGKARKLVAAPSFAGSFVEASLLANVRQPVLRHSQDQIPQLAGTSFTKLLP